MSLIATKEPRKFYFAIDFSSCSEYALEWGLFHFCIQPSDEIVLLSILTPPGETTHAHHLRVEFNQDDEERKHIEIQKKLWNMLDQKYKLKENHSWLQPNFRVEIGHPREKLVHIVNEEKPTMLVMGNHGKQGTTRELGSVSDYCLKHSKVPVIIIREGIWTPS